MTFKRKATALLATAALVSALAFPGAALADDGGPVDVDVDATYQDGDGVGASVDTSGFCANASGPVNFNTLAARVLCGSGSSGD